jgi:hypothetical protein
MTRHPVLHLVVQTLAVTAILACAVAVVALHPLRVDLTPGRRFTLSSWTREVLARLATDVRVTVFYSSQTPELRHELTDLLDRYHDAQPRVHARFLDLDRSPGAAKRLGVSTYNTAVVEAGARRQQLDLVNEGTLTGAVLAVAGTPAVPTYFVVGHGERNPDDDDPRDGASALARALAAEGFVERTIAGAAAIPVDAGLVVLAGPTRELRPAEVDALETWVRGGGRLLVLADPGTPESVGRLTARFGIELSRDLVVDERGRLFGTDGRSARVAYLNQNLLPTALEAPALLPEAQSVRTVDVPGVRADYLAMTPEDTWADVDRRLAADGATFRAGRDRPGPLPVAALARVATPDGREGRIAVIGDADLASNLDVGVLGNRDFLLAVTGLVARDAAVTAARPPAPPGGTLSPLTLTAREARALFWGVVVAPPALLALVAAWRARRRARAAT